MHSQLHQLLHSPGNGSALASECIRRTTGGTYSTSGPLLKALLPYRRQTYLSICSVRAENKAKCMQLSKRHLPTLCTDLEAPEGGSNPSSKQVPHVVHIRATGVRIDERDMIAEEGAKTSTLRSRSTCVQNRSPSALGYLATLKGRASFRVSSHCDCMWLPPCGTTAHFSGTGC